MVLVSLMDTGSINLALFIFYLKLHPCSIAALDFSSVSPIIIIRMSEWSMRSLIESSFLFPIMHMQFYAHLFFFGQ